MNRDKCESILAMLRKEFFITNILLGIFVDRV